MVANAHLYMRKWSQVLQHDISLLDWERVWRHTSRISRCVAHKESAYKVLMHWYRTPDILHARNPTVPKQCWRCNNAVGSHFHIFWECPPVHRFWLQVKKLLEDLVEAPVTLTPMICLVGLPFPGVPKALRRLISFILLAAKRVIPRLWLSSSPPTIPQLLSTVADIRKMEQLTATVEGTEDKFSDTWSVWDDSVYGSKGDESS